MIINADILQWAATYTGPKFHALLSDPPYHLTSIVERFGKPGAAPAQYGTDGAFARAGKGFMGKDWDGGDIAFRPDTWAAIAEHLYPGAWGMAFAGSRGWHRMACAIEDAGLIMQPTIFGWSYGSGFPKATRIDTQIDAAAFRAWLKLHPIEQAAYKAAQAAERAARKARDTQATKEAKTELQALTLAYKALAGLEPRVIGKSKRHAGKTTESGSIPDYARFGTSGDVILDCATDAARYWLGHRYGGQALKPAIEPLIVFQKPYDSGPLACITSTGAGALWIDGGRIHADDSLVRPSVARDGYSTIGAGLGAGVQDEPAGRWPANLILSHSPACADDCAPGCPVARLGTQSGESVSRMGGVSGTNANPMSWTEQNTDRPRGGIDDTGTAARFFHQSDYMYERLELADAIAYVAKASRAEREAGLDPRQTAIMRLLDDSDGDEFDETTVDDGRETPIDNPYQRGDTARRNTNPCIKPIYLTRYLATLLLPPAEYGPRRLLIPFSGAGSEVIGADLAGWEEVTGVELGADHVAIANARRAYWQQRRWEYGDPARKLTVKAAPKAPKGQIDMFVESEAA